MESVEYVTYMSPPCIRCGQSGPLDPALITEGNWSSIHCSSCAIGLGEVCTQQQFPKKHVPYRNGLGLNKLAFVLGDAELGYCITFNSQEKATEELDHVAKKEVSSAKYNESFAVLVYKLDQYNQVIPGSVRTVRPYQLAALS